MAKRQPKSKPRRKNRAANARNMFEHYTALGQGALRSGDAISSENYYQHAEHYFRIIKCETEKHILAQADRASLMFINAYAVRTFKSMTYRTGSA